MALPSDYFKPVLDSLRLSNQVSDDISVEELQRKVIENLRINFLRGFQPGFAGNIALPENLIVSESAMSKAGMIMSEAHNRFQNSLVGNNRIFDIYLDDDSYQMADKFKTGEAVAFFEKTLKPYLADMIDRGVLDEEAVIEKYNQFLTTTDDPECKCTEHFWDSDAARFYGFHALYQQAAEKLRQVTESHAEDIKQSVSDGDSVRPVSQRPSPGL